MLIRLAVFLLEHSPMLRRWIWRRWYGKLAGDFTQRHWTFMNYGYAPPAGAPALSLTPEDEPDRLCIQLYAHVASAAPLAGREVLEVGSGRGGGASWLARTHSPKRYLGVDFSAEAVALCRTRHAGISNLEFAQGDAENLPLPDASFDIVLNVESSHCYGHVDKFFREAVRVLRPGGWFLYTDLREAADMAELERALAATPGWTQVLREDITERVAESLTVDDARKRELIDALVPPKLRHIFGEFAGLKGGQVYEGFRARKLLYRRFAFRKD
jgi:SAM-dependent methyltransferase